MEQSTVSCDIWRVKWK